MMVRQCVRVLRQSHLLQPPALAKVTAVRCYRYDKKGRLKKNRIPPDWRKVDHNPAKIPWAWIPDSWEKENTTDYEREKELVKYIPGYKPKLIEEEHSDYHKEPVYQFSSDTKLVEGLKQSLYLTKSVLFEEMPQRIQQLSGEVSFPNQDDRVIQVFRHALLFDIDPKNLDKEEKMPHVKVDNIKIFPGIERYCPTILENMIRLCQSQSHIFPSLMQRIRAPDITTSAIFRRICDMSMDSASDIERNWLVMLKGSGGVHLLARKPLGVFADEDEVKKTESMNLPDIFPVFPIVDLEKTHIYQPLNSTGLLSDFSHSHVHTLVIRNIAGYSAEEIYGQMTSQLFTSLFSRAVKEYGDSPMVLPQPISGQCIASDGKDFQFMCMQLNTTKLDCDTGIKNMVWIDNKTDESDINPYSDVIPTYSALPMFEECSPRVWRTPEYHTGYDPAVFQTFLSLWLNGAETK